MSVAVASVFQPPILKYGINLFFKNLFENINIDDIRLPESQILKYDIYDKAQDLLLPWWSEDPDEVHVRHHDDCDEATEGPRYGLVLLPEKVVFELDRKMFDADLL